MSVALINELPEHVQKTLLKKLVVKEKFNRFGKGAVCNVFRKHNGTIRIPYTFGRNLGAFTHRDFPKTTGWKMELVLRNYQEEIIPECMKNYKETGCNTLQLYCGFGKQLTAIYLAQLISSKTKTLILLPDNKMIRNGWVKCIEERTTASVQIVGVDKLDDTAQIYVSM